MNLAQAMRKGAHTGICGGNVSAAMRMARKLAENGVYPRQKNGAVVLDSHGAVIGKGWGEHAEMVALQDALDNGYTEEEISTVVATQAPSVSSVERLLQTSCEGIVFVTPPDETASAEKWTMNERAWVQL